MIFIKYPFAQVYFLKTWADGSGFYLFRRQVQQCFTQPFGHLFLFSIFSEAISCIFCDVTALPLEFQPLLIRAGAPFCVA